MRHHFTVDVEEHFQGSAFEGSVSREDWDGLASRVKVCRGVLDVTCRLDAAEIVARRRNAMRLIEAVSRSDSLAAPTPVDGAVPGYLRFPLLEDGGARRACWLPRARALGIVAGYPRALVDLAGFRMRILNLDGEFPGARSLAGRLATLPTHSRLTESDLLGLESWMGSRS